MFNERLCKITYIAHGATIYTEENRLTDNENYPPLNEEGLEEIEHICNFLKIRRVKNDRIYSSSGSRALESAEIIAKIYKKTVEIDDNLTPRRQGEWNNLTLEKIFKKDKNIIKTLLSSPKVPPCEGAESLEDFTKRIGKEIDKLIKNNIGNRIIIVTYPDVIQAATAYALKLPPQAMLNFSIKTGSATQISYYKTASLLKYSGYIPIN